jgi:hypothetical protein
MGLLHAVQLASGWNADHFRSNAQLRAENALLRHQLLIATRSGRKSRLTGSDRAIFVWLCRWMPAVRYALVLVKPETVARWHRTRFRAWWRWKWECENTFQERKTENRSAALRSIPLNH